MPRNSAVAERVSSCSVKYFMAFLPQSYTHQIHAVNTKMGKKIRKKPLFLRKNFRFESKNLQKRNQIYNFASDY